jgi:hypothetical protein
MALPRRGLAGLSAWPAGAADQATWPVTLGREWPPRRTRRGRRRVPAPTCPAESRPARRPPTCLRPGDESSGTCSLCAFPAPTDSTLSRHLYNPQRPATPRTAAVMVLTVIAVTDNGSLAILADAPVLGVFHSPAATPPPPPGTSRAAPDRAASRLRRSAPQPRSEWPGRRPSDGGRNVKERFLGLSRKWRRWCATWSG